MNKENLIAKGVKHAFNGQETIFNVNSLKEHFDGIEIHDVDLLQDEFEDQDEDYVKASDVNFASAVPKEVAVKEEFLSTFPEPIFKKEVDLGMSYTEAEELLKIGKLIALPEWEGFWFANIHKDLILVFTKEGEILETPLDEFRERNDWKEVEATPEQKEILDKYFEAQNAVLENIETNVDDSEKEDVIEEKNAGTEETSAEGIGLPKPKEPKKNAKK